MIYEMKCQCLFRQSVCDVTDLTIIFKFQNCNFLKETLLQFLGRYLRWSATVWDASRGIRIAGKCSILLHSVAGPIIAIWSIVTLILPITNLFIYTYPGLIMYFLTIFSFQYSAVSESGTPLFNFFRKIQLSLSNQSLYM